MFLKSKWNSDIENLNQQYTFPDMVNDVIRKKLLLLKSEDVPPSFLHYISDIDIENVINSKEENVELNYFELSEKEEMEDNYNEKTKSIVKEEIIEIMKLQLK